MEGHPMGRIGTACLLGRIRTGRWDRLSVVRAWDRQKAWDTRLSPWAVIGQAIHQGGWDQAASWAGLGQGVHSAGLGHTGHLVGLCQATYWAGLGQAAHWLGGGQATRWTGLGQPTFLRTLHCRRKVDKVET